MTLANFIDRSHREKEEWRYTDLETLLAALHTRAACQCQYRLYAKMPMQSAPASPTGIYQRHLATQTIAFRLCAFMHFDGRS